MLLSVTVCATGCGSARVSSTSTSASRQRSAAALSRTEFAQIQAVFKANVPLDEGFQQWRIRAIDIACQRISRQDSLLTTFRRLCLEEVTTDELQEDDLQCPQSAGVLNAEAASRELVADRRIANCGADALDGLATANAVLVARSRQVNQIVNRTVTATPCRAALHIPHRFLAYSTKVSVLIRRVAAATRLGASVPMQRAEAAWNRLNEANPFPSNRAQLAEFDKGCA